MTYPFVTCLIVMVWLPGTLFAGDLKGEVVLVGEQDDKTPAVGVDVTIKETGDSGKTKAGGLFRITLPDRLKTKGSVMLLVSKPGWIIQYPLDGETPIPTNLDTLVHIQLLPKGSKKLWSADRIEKFIRDTAEKAKTQVKPDTSKEQPVSIEFGRYIKEWAVQYGFTPQQTKVEIDKWAREVERKQGDFYRLGLAEYYKKNFHKAYELATESGERHAKAYEQKTQEAETYRAQAIRDYKLAGDAAYSDYRFQDALTAYTQASRYVPREMASTWAELQNDIGASNWALGIRVAGAQSPKHLQAAVAAHRAALSVYTKEQLPQDWAATQNNLGIALHDQGTRSGGEEGTRLLAEAVVAYRTALTVYTKERLPQQWAMIQTNLGLVLRDQGTRSRGEEGTRLLAEAVAAYRAAFTVYTKEQLPQQWAVTQTNLGLALWEQGRRTGGEEGMRLLAEAVTAYRVALTVRTKEQLPQDWAMTQTNLGIALWEQGTRSRGEEGMRLLAEAVTAYRAALTVRTKEQLPQDWARTQNNLGTALRNQGTGTGGEEKTHLLAEAVAAYKAALQIHSREHLPQDWAQTHNNLAEAYLALENWEGAAESYRNVLSLYPNYEKAYAICHAVYHEKLFLYDEAFALNKEWVGRHPDDLAAEANFAEVHVTTGRLSEAHDRLAALISNSRLPVTTLPGLRVLEIVDLVALNRTDSIPGKLDTLQDFISSQSDQFTGEWSLEGTKHFVAQNPRLERYRSWLLDLLAGFEGKKRDEMLVAVGGARQAFQSSARAGTSSPH